MVTIFGMFPAYVSVVFSRTGSGSSMYIYASVATPFQKFQEFTARRACQPAAYAPWSRRCLLILWKSTMDIQGCPVPNIGVRGPQEGCARANPARALMRILCFKSISHQPQNHRNDGLGPSMRNVYGIQYIVYIHTHVGLVSAVPGALVTTRLCEDRAYKSIKLFKGF